MDAKLHVTLEQNINDGMMATAVVGATVATTHAIMNAKNKKGKNVETSNKCIKNKIKKDDDNELDDVIAATAVTAYVISNYIEKGDKRTENKEVNDKTKISKKVKNNETSNKCSKQNIQKNNDNELDDAIAMAAVTAYAISNSKEKSNEDAKDNQVNGKTDKHKKNNHDNELIDKMKATATTSNSLTKEENKDKRLKENVKIVNTSLIAQYHKQLISKSIESKNSSISILSCNKKREQRINSLLTTANIPTTKTNFKNVKRKNMIVINTIKKDQIPDCCYYPKRMKEFYGRPFEYISSNKSKQFMVIVCKGEEYLCKLLLCSCVIICFSCILYVVFFDSVLRV